MSALSDSDRPLYIKRLIATIQCANCGEKYSLNDIHILGHRGDLWVSAVVCGQCDTQGLIFAMVQDEEQIQVLADTDAEEEKIFDSLPEISMNDVLDMHLFLSGYCGDFSELFGEVHDSGQADESGSPGDDC